MMMRKLAFLPCLLAVVGVSQQVRADDNTYTDTAKQSHSVKHDVADGAAVVVGAGAALHYRAKAQTGDQIVNGIYIRSVGNPLRERIDYLSGKQDIRATRIFSGPANEEVAAIGKTLERGAKITTIDLQLTRDGKWTDFQFHANSAAEAEKQLAAIRAQGIYVNRVIVNTVREWTPADLAQNKFELVDLKKQLAENEKMVSDGKTKIAGWRGLSRLGVYAALFGLADGIHQAFSDSQDATACDPSSPRCAASSDHSGRAVAGAVSTGSSGPTNVSGARNASD